MREEAVEAGGEKQSRCLMRRAHPAAGLPESRHIISFFELVLPLTLVSPVPFLPPCRCCVLTSCRDEGGDVDVVELVDVLEEHRLAAPHLGVQRVQRCVKHELYEILLLWTVNEQRAQQHKSGWADQRSERGERRLDLIGCCSRLPPMPLNLFVLTCIFDAVACICV